MFTRLLAVGSASGFLLSTATQNFKERKLQAFKCASKKKPTPQVEKTAEGLDKIFEQEKPLTQEDMEEFMALHQAT